MSNKELLEQAALKKESQKQEAPKQELSKQDECNLDCEKQLDTEKSVNSENEDDTISEHSIRQTELDIDELIKDLMGCVSRDEKGNLIVKDFLTDPTIVEQIISRAIPVMKNVKPMLELQAPMYIVGDLHGQFTDLLRIFEMCGNPKTTNYLFLGDYVDRGPNCLETICLLLLLKIRYPWRVYLLRGNHECSAINRTHGFADECEERYQKIPIIKTAWGVKAKEMKGRQIWLRFQDVFNWFPFTALINGKILCMHGGLSPTLENLNQLQSIQRPIDPCIEVGLATDLLWADPDPSMPYGETDPEWGPSIRGVSSHFNVRAVKFACQRLGLDMIVRAHQVVQDGYDFFANRKLVTIFSVPNYCGLYNNSGAVMHLDKNLLVSFKILKATPGTPLRKKKPLEVNFDDVDLDALVEENGPESDEKLLAAALANSQNAKSTSFNSQNLDGKPLDEKSTSLNSQNLDAKSTLSSSQNLDATPSQKSDAKPVEPKSISPDSQNSEPNSPTTKEK